ncbi:hypothetical protein BJ508DRAFT_331275 [Ascobolus immersus RN42]|uniref:Uncharacterized protein n=1 Tax=Ascobolus immersus RN42 TaxID=1160509 RepID=A0A3N4HRH5_ASCIM|nr:hypothetical protein BJ508DRAFT_331275 [Ascobolus immersus RN42]
MVHLTSFTALTFLSLLAVALAAPSAPNPSNSTTGIGSLQPQANGKTSNWSSSYSEQLHSDFQDALKDLLYKDYNIHPHGDSVQPPETEATPPLEVEQPLQLGQTTVDNVQPPMAADEHRDDKLDTGFGRGWESDPEYRRPSQRHSQRLQRPDDPWKNPREATRKAEVQPPSSEPEHTFTIGVGPPRAEDWNRNEELDTGFGLRWDTRRPEYRRRRHPQQLQRTFLLRGPGREG